MVHHSQLLCAGILSNQFTLCVNRNLVQRKSTLNKQMNNYRFELCPYSGYGAPDKFISSVNCSLEMFGWYLFMGLKQFLQLEWSGLCYMPNLESYKLGNLLSTPIL